MDLPRLYGNFYGESERLIVDINRSRSLAASSRQRGIEERVYIRAQQMSVIRVIDSWGRFCRSLIFLSSYANPRTESGLIVAKAPGIQSRQDVARRIGQLYKARPQKEPSWHIPKYAVDAARNLQIDNLTTVSLALGSTPNPIDDMCILRNAIAHRSFNAIDRMNQVVAKHGHIGLDAHEFITVSIVPGITIFEDWMLQVRSIARAAVQ